MEAVRDLDRRLQAVRQPERPVPLGREEDREAARLQPPELVVVVQLVELLLDRRHLPLVATRRLELTECCRSQVLQGDAVGLGLLRQRRGRQVDRDARLAMRRGEAADLGEGRNIDVKHGETFSLNVSCRVA